VNARRGLGCHRLGVCGATRVRHDGDGDPLVMLLAFLRQIGEEHDRLFAEARHEP
jgi:hypothetical protein